MGAPWEHLGGILEPVPGEEAFRGPQKATPDSPRDPKRPPKTHLVEHVIDTKNAQPTRDKLRRLPPSWQQEISKQIKTPEARVNEESLALTLAIKLTQKENLVAAKIPPYEELLSQVSDSNQQQDYERTVEILDEDIANRTPDEQRKALKISGLMSVLIASKKLKRAISTIDDYDLPDDPSLREIEAALSEWVSKNLVLK